ncbi:hypothetical protein ABZ780_04530 [Micromonospora sp. NPDC047467]
MTPITPGDATASRTPRPPGADPEAGRRPALTSDIREFFASLR